MSLDPELLEIFRQETDERLDRMIDTLLAVEAGTAAEDAIDQLFRDAHSIKGNAGMVGFDVAAKVAGAVEDILESAREANALDPALTAPLLRATDAIRAAVEGQDGPAAAALAELSGTAAVAPEPEADAPELGAGCRALGTPAHPARRRRPRGPAARRRGRDRPAPPPPRASARPPGPRRRPAPARGDRPRRRAARGAPGRRRPDAHPAARVDRRDASRARCATSR